jgi:predicted ATPase/class 3 adenylate cyclase
MPRAELPTGTVTFLFTDVEGSTKLLHALGEGDYAEALAEHRRTLREAFERHRGVEVDTQGDAFFVAFPGAGEALAAAEEARESLANGPISVRIGLHTGTPLVTDEGYVGFDVHRAARIAAAGHGGQVVVSASTAELLRGNGATLVDLGEHRLKDLTAPERLFQLGESTYPPLKTLSISNLPLAQTPFLGREPELEQLSELLRDPAARVVTVTGTGGIGKTRLALQAAAEASEEFPDGLWWVALAPLSDPAQMTAALAQALGVREDEGVGLATALAERFEGRRALVLLDNAEHLLPGLVGEITPLLQASEALKVLVTSRERLQTSAEHVLAVPPLSAHDAVELFRTRASALGVAVDGAGTVDTICERLDRLPLALQLAAARLRTLSPDQLLERLAGRLDLLKGGPDLDSRQQTIRATIEWSHDLLTSEEQALFRRLAVFVGGSTLEAVETVCEADVDVIEGLVEKSLLQRRTDAPEPRFWMLESIHDFAAERLDEEGERDRLRTRHAAYFRDLAARMDASARSGEPEEISATVLGADVDNLRAAVTYGLESADTDLVREITASLRMYWMFRGLYAEARSWLERALTLTGQEDELRRRLLSSLATFAYSQGDHVTAVEASDGAAALAMRLGGVTERYELLREQARAAGLKRELSSAERLWEEAFQAAREVDNGVGMSACRLNLVVLANGTGRHDRAEELLHENLPFVRSRGQTRCEAWTLAGLAETSLCRDRPEDAAEPARGGAERGLRINDEPLTAYCLDLFAAAAAGRGDIRRAATVLGTTEAAREAMGVAPDEEEAAIRARALERLDGGGPAVEQAWAEGRTLDLASALELAASD